LLELARFWFDVRDDEAHQDGASVEILSNRKTRPGRDAGYRRIAVAAATAATALTFLVSEETAPVNRFHSLETITFAR
jgi:hypothetical protein